MPRRVGIGLPRSSGPAALPPSRGSASCRRPRSLAPPRCGRRASGRSSVRRSQRTCGTRRLAVARFRNAALVVSREQRFRPCGETLRQPQASAPVVHAHGRLAPPELGDRHDMRRFRHLRPVCRLSRTSQADGEHVARDAEVLQRARQREAVRRDDAASPWKSTKLFSSKSWDRPRVLWMLVNTLNSGAHADVVTIAAGAVADDLVAFAARGPGRARKARSCRAALAMRRIHLSLLMVMVGFRSCAYFRGAAQGLRWKPKVLPW